MRLPKSKSDWDLANAFIHSIFNEYDWNQLSANFDHVVSDIQLRIYLYFETTYGSVSSHVSPFEGKYQNKSTKELKSALKLLKSNRANLDEIKYVSKLIRSSLKNKQDNNFGLDQINLEKSLLHKFWSTCHDLFNKATNSLPTFSIVDCEHFFRRVLTTTNVSRFIVPGWIPRLEQPGLPFVESPPTYKEVATIIREARKGASAGPMDQLSILILQKCPMARTILHLIICECWRSRRIPECWKRSATILIYKKGDTSDPGNFRPITLQAVWYKILASVMKTRLYSFLNTNKYLDKTKQKGFWPKQDGVTEHTEMLSHIMRDAKKHCRGLVVTLLDLKNRIRRSQPQPNQISSGLPPCSRVVHPPVQ